MMLGRKKIFISYTKLPIALHTHTWVWELAPGAICAYASPTFGRPEGEGREAGGLSSQTACSRCMNSPQLWFGRQPPESPWPGLNAADHSEPKPCLTLAFTGSTRGGFLQKRRDLQEPNGYSLKNCSMTVPIHYLYFFSSYSFFGKSHRSFPMFH